MAAALRTQSAGSALVGQAMGTMKLVDIPVVERTPFLSAVL